MPGFFNRIVTLVTGDAAPAPSPERFHIHGVPIVVDNTRPDIATADVVERLTEALGLIATHQPWRLRHLQRDIQGIRVERFACRGAYLPG